MKEKNKKWVQEAEMKKNDFTAKTKKKVITTAQLQDNKESNPEKFD